MRKTAITSLLFMFFSIAVIAQSSVNNKLALEYFKNEEYEKAADLYAELYRQTGTRTHFDYLIKSLVALEEYSKAIKAVKQQIKQYPEDPNYEVDLGMLYKREGNPGKANKIFADLIEDLPNSQSVISKLGNHFVSYREYDWAIETYKAGQKKIRGTYGFHTELADAYFYLSQYPEMVNEYVALLGESDQFSNTVQNRLQYLLFNDVDGSLGTTVENGFIAASQRQPNRTVYHDMLVWFYVQKKQFEKAFIHANALDKRFEEDGHRLFELGDLALSNKDVATAIKCFEAVMDKGTESPYYFEGRGRLLKSKLEKLKLTARDENEQVLQTLSGGYSQAIHESGITVPAFDMVLEYAHVLNFYMHLPDSAINLLDTMLDLPKLRSTQKNEAEMLKGDCYLTTGDIWEANLIFAKIEKYNSHNPFGHEAKFRRARIAYFSGNFEFAETLLNILKASTSKLISNDAFALSQLINDNTALDTSLQAMSMYATADFLFFQHKDSLAFINLDSITELFPGHSLSDEVLFRKAKFYEDNQQFDSAAVYYQLVVDRYSYDVLADNACFSLGVIYETKLQDSEKAQFFFKKILTDFPSSIFVPEARARFRKLRGDKFN